MGTMFITWLDSEVFKVVERIFDERMFWICLEQGYSYKDFK